LPGKLRKKKVFLTQTHTNTILYYRNYLSTGKIKLKRETQNLTKAICTYMHDRRKCFENCCCCDVHVYRPISGGSMNPARTLGPAIATSSYKGLWLYFVGPITGAILAAWSYNVIRDTEHPGFPFSLSSLSFKARNRTSGTQQVGKTDHQCLV